MQQPEPYLVKVGYCEPIRKLLVHSLLSHLARASLQGFHVYKYAPDGQGTSRREHFQPLLCTAVCYGQSAMTDVGLSGIACLLVMKKVSELTLLQHQLHHAWRHTRQARQTETQIWAHDPIR